MVSRTVTSVAVIYRAKRGLYYPVAQMEVVCVRVCVREQNCERTDGSICLQLHSIDVSSG